jgi:Mlc titration factor MtfA (ptsG expression regulator)/regulator of sirC expression with transglutaminase-like and TPR domain
MFSWLKTRRRRRILSQPFPMAWLAYLKANLHQYRALPPQAQDRLRDLTQIFVAEKTWVPCGGLAIDDQVRVSIAAQACLLLLGFPGEFCFDSVRSVLVYPGGFVKMGPVPGTPLVAEDSPVVGEAWHRGPIVLAWDHALAGGQNADQGHSVVLHEFAHHLDDLDGAMDGVPPLGSRDDYQRWHQVMQREFERLRRAADRNAATLLDQYGASSPPEFFAVATECFFQRPEAMQRRHRELYELLRKFYAQDPAAWQQPASPETDEERYEESVRECVHEMRLDPDGADGRFAAGMVHAQNGRPQRAVDCFSEAIRLNPSDGEAYQQRAAMYVELGRAEDALADSNHAIRIDSADVEAYRIHGAIYAARQDYAGAIEDFDRILQRAKKDADAYYRRGMARAALQQYAAAVADFDQAIRYAPGRPEYRSARVEAEEKRVGSRQSAVGSEGNDEG